MGPDRKGDEVDASEGQAKLFDKHVDVGIGYEESGRGEAQEHRRVGAAEDLDAYQGCDGGGDTGPEDHDCIVDGSSQARVCDNDGGDTCEKGDGEIVGDLGGERQHGCEQGCDGRAYAAPDTPPEDLGEGGGHFESLQG